MGLKYTYLCFFVLCPIIFATVETEIERFIRSTDSVWAFILICGKHDSNNSCEPIWNSMSSIEVAKDDLRILQFDQQEHITKQYHLDNDVPAIYLFNPDVDYRKQKPKRYRGALNTDRMTSFLAHAIGIPVSRKINLFTSTCIYTLDHLGFSSVVFNPEVVNVVLFCMPTAAECIEARAEIEHIALTYCGDTQIRMNYVDVSLNSDLASKHKINKIPSIVVYDLKQSSRPILYDGTFKAKPIVEFLTSITSSTRTLGGGFNMTVGAHKEAKPIIQGFCNLSRAKQAERLHKISSQSFCQLLDDPSCHEVQGLYQTMMHRIMEDDSSFINGELQRLKHLINSGQVGAKKLRDLNLKQTVIQHIKLLSGA